MYKYDDSTFDPELQVFSNRFAFTPLEEFSPPLTDFEERGVLILRDKDCEPILIVRPLKGVSTFLQEVKAGLRAGLRRHAADFAVRIWEDDIYLVLEFYRDRNYTPWGNLGVYEALWIDPR